MQPPAYLIKKGVLSLPCIGDGRQSGTSGSPSILNASPEAAVGGGLALLLKTGDRVRIDLRKGTADILITDDEIAPPRRTAAKAAISYPATRRRGRRSSAAWSTSSEGMVLKPAVKYRDVAHNGSIPLAVSRSKTTTR
jgi:dihydroxy-acid dehydratase